MAAIQSTVLMGGVLLVVILAIGLVRDWERSPAPEMSQGASVVEVVRSPMTWTLGFVVLAVLIVIGAIGFVGGSNVLGIGRSEAELILLSVFGVAIVGFLFVGLYAAGRNRGLKNAQAAGIGSILLAFLLVVVISLRLLTTP
jgi:uncharacterized integral membrane protein